MNYFLAGSAAGAAGAAAGAAPSLAGSAAAGAAAALSLAGSAAAGAAAGAAGFSVLLQAATDNANKAANNSDLFMCGSFKRLLIFLLNRCWIYIQSLLYLK
jgi:hypothetical protein